MNIEEALKRLGYHQILSEPNKVLFDSTKKILGEYLGLSALRALLHQISSLSGLPERELSTKNELLVKSLRKVLGPGTDVILELVKKEAFQFHQEEALDFVRNVPQHEHFVLLYNSEGALDKILSEFFSPVTTGKAPKGLISVKPAKIDVRNMLYNELLGVEKSTAMQKLAHWLSELHSSNKSDIATRIAGEDTWFFENGFDEEILNLEEGLGRRLRDNMDILCTYKLSKLARREMIAKVISPHDFVIVDEPLRVYKAN